MKTIKFFLTIVAFTIVTVTTAVEKPQMNVIRLDDEKALIAISNEKPAHFELSITSEYGDLVYYKESESELANLRQVINYAALENGLYTMKLKVNDTFLTTDFKIDNSGMKVGETKINYEPYFSYSGNVLKLSYLNFDKENVRLRIYNNGDLEFENKLGKDFVINAGYDLSKLNPGTYQIELSSLTNQFSYNLEK